MAVYASSDWHFFHDKIRTFCPESRNFATVDEMNETIIANCNKKVQTNDTLYLLGDISFWRVQPTIDLLKQINCRHIHFIIGNHDHDIIRKEKFRDCFESIEHYKEINHNGNKFVLSHFPFLEWNGSRRGINSSYMLHGHQHSRNPDILSCKRWDCGLDGSPDFSPYDLDWLVDEIDKRLVI
jgi:calcineurin-like phosphoesterase family protein